MPRKVNMLNFESLVFYYLACVNLLGLGIFGLDKGRAVRGAYRIRESVLHSFGAAGGCFGVLFGVALFRHKIRKARFLMVEFSFALIYLILLMAIR